MLATELHRKERARLETAEDAAVPSDEARTEARKGEKEEPSADDDPEKEQHQQEPRFARGEQPKGECLHRGELGENDCGDLAERDHDGEEHFWRRGELLQAA